MKHKLIKFQNEKIIRKTILKTLENNNSKFKTILFIEPYGSTISLLKRGVENGYSVIILTANQGLRIVPDEIIELAQFSFLVDTADTLSVINLVKLLDEYIVIDAVIPGFEYFVPVASMISDFLNLPCTDMVDIKALRNKFSMRSKLLTAGIPIPKYKLVNSLGELNEAMKVIGFPAVCKPVDAAGSVNVKKVNNSAEAHQAATRILEAHDVLWGYPISKQLLYEEYIEGKEYSVEGTVTNGKIIFFSITEKFVADEIEFIEVGHIVNPPMDEHLNMQIKRYIAEVISVLRPNNCPFHAEIRINQDGQPVLMEIAARLAGDKIGDLINLSRNINYFDYVYYSYLGDSRQPTSMQNYHAGIRFFYRPKLDKISHVIGVKEAKEYDIEELCLYYSLQTTIPEFPKPLRRLGHVMMKGKDYAKIVKTLTLIDESILFS